MVNLVEWEADGVSPLSTAKSDKLQWLVQVSLWADLAIRAAARLLASQTIASYRLTTLANSTGSVW